MADFEVTGEASIDPDHMIEDVEALIDKLDELEVKLDELDAKLDELSGKDVRLEVVIEGQDKLDELMLFLEDLDSHDYTVKIRVDVEDKKSLDDLYIELLEMELHDHNVRVKVGVDGSADAIAKLEAVNAAADDTSKKMDKAGKSSEGFSFSLMMLAPLLAPLSAGIISLVGGVGGLAAIAGATAVPLGAFGLAVKGVYGDITTLAGGLNAATTAALDNSSSFTKSYAILEKNSAAFRNMNSSMKDVTVQYFLLQNSVRGFEQAVQPEATQALSIGFGILRDAIKSLTPAAIEAGEQLDGVLQDLHDRLQDPTFKKFFTDATNDVGLFVADWGDGVVNIVEGVAAILDAFLPLGVDMSNGFDSMTQKFDTWAQHLGQSEGFKKFVATVEKDGPVILNILGQLVRIIANVVGALGEQGGNSGFLQFLDKMLKALSGFTSTHQGLTAAAADLGLVGAAAIKLGPALGPIMDFLMTPVGAVVGVLVALGAAFFIAYQKSKQFHDWVDANLGPLWAKLIKDIQQFKQWAISIWPEIQEVWDKYGSNIENIIKDHFGFIVTFIGGVLKIIEGIVDLFVGILTGKWGLAWNGIVKILTGVWSIIEGMFLEMFQLGTQIFEMLWKVITTNASTAWSKIEGLFTTYTVRIIGDVARFFTNIVSSAITGMVQFASSIATHIAQVGTWFAQLPGKILGWLGDLGGLLVQAGKNIISGLINGIESMFGPLESVFNDLTSWIPDLKGPPEKDKQLLHNAGQLLIQGLIDGMESKYSAVENSLGGLTKSIGGTFGTQFTTDISAQLNAQMSRANMGALSGGAQQGGNVIFNSGAIQISNPTPETPSTTIARVQGTMAKTGMLQAPAGLPAFAGTVG